MAEYQIGFRSLGEELSARGLDVEGEVPDWLDGALIRNGPGQFEVAGEQLEHWFDGLAMLRRFGFDAGSVTYTNRFLRTEAYERTRDGGSLGTAQFGSSPSGVLEAILARLLPSSTDNTNVNVMRAGDTFIALTETPRYVAFDHESLETDGPWTFEDDIDGHLSCAHPVSDPQQGEMVNLLTAFGRTHEYRVTVRGEGATGRELLAAVPTDRVGYMHSFAVTPNYVVLIEPPLFVDLGSVLNPFAGGTFLDSLEWQPDAGSRFLVIDRADGSLVAELDGPPFFYFHQANAFERDGSLLLDMVTFADASVINALSLSDLSAGEFAHPMGDLTRFRLSLQDGTVKREQLYSGHLSLPRVNETVRTEPYRFVYAQGAAGTDRTTFPMGLRKVDVRTGGTDSWSAPNLYCGEPVFVPRPGSEPEDAGVVLSVVLDTEREQSGLLVLDGQTFEREAIAWVPHVLPFDFHGQYFEPV